MPWPCKPPRNRRSLPEASNERQKVTSTDHPLIVAYQQAELIYQHIVEPSQILQKPQPACDNIHEPCHPVRWFVPLQNGHLAQTCQ